MRVLTDLRQFRTDPGSGLVLGLGNFDGLHLGHRALLKRVAAKAAVPEATSAVLTFRKHPQSVLDPEHKPSLLMSAGQKLLGLSDLGLDSCFLLDFSEALSKMSPEEFVRDILVTRLRAREVYMGYSAHFGHGRRGNPALMKELAGRYGFGFEEIRPVKIGGEGVSSTRIRAQIKAGDLEGASACLGRDFRVFARVVCGEGRGRSIGYPTANLEVQNGILPPAGVYLVSVSTLNRDPEAALQATEEAFPVRLEGPSIPGVMSYGTRPTFPESRPGLVPEVFLIDFEGDIYGKYLEVVFHERLREEKAFDGAQALKEQIAQDIKLARRRFEVLAKKNFTKAGE